MNKSMTLCTVIVFVILGICAQTMALDPDELIAIREAADKALNEHDLDTMMSYWADDCIYDYVPLPEPFVGKEAVRNFFEALFVGFPDFGTTEGLVRATENTVVVEHSTNGTHQGEWMGIPPTGNSAPAPHIDVFEFEGDKIKRATTYLDAASVMIQLGVLPAPDMPELVPSIPVPDPEPTGLSPLEANAEAVRRWNSHDPAQVSKIYHSEAAIFIGPLGASLDRAAAMALNEMYFQGFPNVTINPVRTIDLGDGWIVFEYVAFGIHNGPFMGVPASGYPGEVRVVWLTHFDSDGLVTQQSVYYDNMTLMSQITQAPEYLPDGTWVVTVPTEAGIATLLHTISPQGKMGGPFAGTMVQVNENPTAFGIFPEADGETDWITKTVWKGRKSLETTMLVYGTKKGEGPLRETVYIGLANATWTLTGSNTNEGTAVEALYLAEQDADGNGFPDPGEEPVACLQFLFTSKRLNMMPPCVPTPIPQ